MTHPQDPPPTVPSPGKGHAIGPAGPATESRFSLVMAARLVSNGVLLGSVAYAMQPITGSVAAVPLALTATLGFSKVVDIAAGSQHSGPVRLGALLGAIVAGTITTSLAYATYYAKTSAPESVRREFLARREVAERQVQQVLSLATTAQKAMVEWSKDAAEKSALEASIGSTCPAKASGKVAGPISAWRKDDSGIAASLAADLGTRGDALRNAAEALAKLPLPADTQALKAGYAAVNTAIDKAAVLVKGGWAEGALTALAERRSSQIDHPAGRVSCGDTGRLGHIERAATELTKLNAMVALARVQPTIDLEKPMEVMTRGLIRGATITSNALTWGHGGNFADDPLMQEQLKTVGWINRETMPYMLSLLAEAIVLLTSFISAQQGRVPFGLSLPAWLRRCEAAAAAASAGPRATPSRWHALAEVLAACGRVLGKLLSNLFWTEAPVGAAATAKASQQAAGQASPPRLLSWLNPQTGRATPAAAPAVEVCDPESSSFGPIDLPADPTLRARELGFAARLAPWHHAWGMADYLLLPMSAGHTDEHHMARALAAQNLAHFVDDSVDWKDLTKQRAAVAPLLHDRLGPDAEHLHYEVWKVTAAYAHLMRLAALAAAAPAVTAPTTRGTPPLRHVPLGLKRLWRQQGAGPFGRG